jgi:hypothetical protein
VISYIDGPSVLGFEEILRLQLISFHILILKQERIHHGRASGDLSRIAASVDTACPKKCSLEDEFWGQPQYNYNAVAQIISFIPRLVREVTFTSELLPRNEITVYSSCIIFRLCDPKECSSSF